MIQPREGKITFPEFAGIRCLMMPFIQGDPDSVPKSIRKTYSDIIETCTIDDGDIGYLTIDESKAFASLPHRGKRAKYGRALHTEVGVLPNKIYCWGKGGWGSIHNVELESDVQILLSNNIDDTCAVWDATQEYTSTDGDIGYLSDKYKMTDAKLLKAGELCQIGILTPHESIPVQSDCNRQFLRIISSGVHGREPYFTENPVINKTHH